MSSISTEPQRNSAYGLGLAFSSFLLWGIYPLYFYMLKDVPPLVTLACRAVFTTVLLVPLILYFHQARAIFRILKTPKMVLCLFLTMFLVCSSWGAFIWLVAIGKSIQSSLGGYLCPLMTFFLSVLFLHEKVSVVGYCSILFAFLAVILFSIGIGEIPWGGIINAGTFTLYAFIRKVVHIDAVVALTVETILATPLGLLLIVFCASYFPNPNAWLCNPWIIALLIGSGLLTAAPLLLYGAAMERAKLSAISILQYTSPTLQFLCAAFILHEEMAVFEWVSFFIIWIALILFSYDSLHESHVIHQKYCHKGH